MTVTLLPISIVARRLGVSIQTVRRLVWSGKLPSLRVARQIRVNSNDLSSWIKGKQSCGRIGPERAAGRLVVALALASAANRVTNSVAGVSSDRTA